MTAGKAIELCDQMRPNNDFGDEMKQMWLRQCDAAAADGGEPLGLRGL